MIFFIVRSLSLVLLLNFLSETVLNYHTVFITIIGTNEILVGVEYHGGGIL